MPWAAEAGILVLTVVVWVLAGLVSRYQRLTARLLAEAFDLHVTLCRLAPKELLALKERWREEEKR